MTDGIDPNLRSSNLVDDTVITHPHFSVAFQAPSERLSVVEGIQQKTLLNRHANAALDIAVDLVEIESWDIGVVRKLIRHEWISAVLSPDFFMGKRCSMTESLGTGVSDLSPRLVLRRGEF